MKTEKYLNKEALIRKDGALIQELGPVETARFVNLSRPKRVESVKRHCQIFLVPTATSTIAQLRLELRVGVDSCLRWVRAFTKYVH